MAGQLGYCGLDRGRQPLTGEEIRGCWESRTGSVATGTSVPLTIAGARPGDDARRQLEFVEVDGVGSAGRRDVTIEDAPVTPPSRLPAEPAWNLWGDLEP